MNVYGFFCSLSMIVVAVLECNGILREPCPRGHFGANCSFECHCKVVNDCQAETGVCEHGCQEGWSGVGCQSRDVAKRGKNSMIAGNQDGYIGPTRDCNHFGRDCVDVTEYFHAMYATVGPHNHCAYTRDFRVQPWWLVEMDQEYVVTQINLLTTRQGIPIEVRVGNWPADMFHRNSLCTSTNIRPGKNRINCTVPTHGKVLSIQNMKRNKQGTYLAARLQICNLEIIAYDYVENCPDRMYGAACLRTCRCFQPDESCDHVNGSCVTGCMPEFIGPACEHDFRLDVPPRVKAKTSHSIELNWEPLLVTRDSLRGEQELRYDVEVMDKAWRRVNDRYYQEDHLNHRFWVNVTGLKPHTKYKFRVMVSRKAYGKVISRSLTAAETGYIRTKCSVPSATPEIMSMESSVEDTTVFPTATKIAVKWVPIKPAHIQCKSVLHYYILYRVHSLENRHWSEVKMRSPNGTTHTDVHKLLPNTWYDIRIGVVNSGGYTSKSRIMAKKTTQGVGGTIQHLRVNSSENHICITWFPPSRSYGTILANYIKYQEMEILGCAMLNSEPKTIIETTRRRDIRGLAPNRRFRISVCASTAVGCGPDVVMDIKTKESLPRTKPPVPSIVSLLADSVRIQLYHLSCVERLGVFRAFKVYITDDITGAIISRGSDSSIIDVYGLKPFTRYRTRYAWINTVGSGPASDFVNFTTAEAPPSAPYIKRYTSSSSMIAVSWSPPRQLNGVLRRYKLRCVLHGHGQLTKETGPDELHHTFKRHIKSHKTYRCQVKAATSAGFGPWSTQQMIKTAYSGYYPIRMVEAPFRGPTWLYFIWKPPLFNAEVVGYTMKCIVTEGDRVVSWREMNHFKGTTAYNLTLLQPDSRYECAMETVGLEGISLTSRTSIIVRTEPLPLPPSTTPPPVTTPPPTPPTRQATPTTQQTATSTKQTSTTEETTMSNLVVK